MAIMTCRTWDMGLFFHTRDSSILEFSTSNTAKSTAFLRLISVYCMGNWHEENIGIFITFFTQFKAKNVSTLHGLSDMI